MQHDDTKPITLAQRNAWLAMDDNALLDECNVDAYRASGPGGQKRNKTSSAVRLRHRPSGLMVISEESRSQHANKRTALRRLRMAIAVDIRPEDAQGEIDIRAMLAGYVTPDNRLRISSKNAEYPHLVAAVLDEVAASRGSLSSISEATGISKSQLIRFVASDDGAFACVNRLRSSAGLPPLRKP